VGVVPFGHGPTRRVAPTDRAGEPLSVCTFGFAAPEKDLERLVDAVSLIRSTLDVELRIVGHCDPDYERQLRSRADELGMSEGLVFTGRQDDDGYFAELVRADVAVQLRRSANGEASAAIADCMSAGIPTVVSRLGAQAELPVSCVEHVRPAVPPEILDEVLRRILTDTDHRHALAAGAAEHAASNSFALAAGAITEALLAGRPPVLRGSLRSWPRLLGR
jgi:glycosyltransferase involved in cell wall biosynthesis